MGVPPSIPGFRGNKVKQFDIDDYLPYHPCMAVITVSSKYQIVIPKEARERFRIKPGTRLQVIADGGGLRLVKESTLEEIRGLLHGMKWEESEVRDETDRNLS